MTKDPATELAEVKAQLAATQHELTVIHEKLARYRDGLKALVQGADDKIPVYTRQQDWQLVRQAKEDRDQWQGVLKAFLTLFRGVVPPG